MGWQHAQQTLSAITSSMVGMYIDPLMCVQTVELSDAAAAGRDELPVQTRALAETWLWKFMIRELPEVLQLSCSHEASKCAGDRESTQMNLSHFLHGYKLQYSPANYL